MAEYDNTNRGAIFKNEKKETPNHPDFTGAINVDGVEYWVSAWKRKEGASPKAPALSFSISPKDKSAISKTQTQSNEQKGSFDDFSDDIPW